MDTDGVDIEVLYCEVSAYRYLYLLEVGAPEATRAFNDTLHDFASADPSRLIVTYQVPIHDIDLAVGEIERVASMGGKSLQLPVFPAELGQPDYFDERYDRMWSRDLETRPARCAATSVSTPRSTSSPIAIPRRGSRGPCRARHPPRARRSACGCSPASSSGSPS